MCKNFPPTNMTIWTSQPMLGTKYKPYSARKPIGTSMSELQIRHTSWRAGQVGSAPSHSRHLF